MTIATWDFTPPYNLFNLLTQTGACCWLCQRTMAWFALSYWWSSCIWYSHQLWGALVKGIKSPRDSKAKSFIWWCTTQDWKNSRHRWDSRFSSPKSEWSRRLACTGILEVNLWLDLDFPFLIFSKYGLCLISFWEFSTSEGFPFNWFQFCEGISRGPKRCYKQGEENL